MSSAAGEAVFLPLAGLTIRAPRSRLSGLSPAGGQLFGGATAFGAQVPGLGLAPSEDDLIAIHRARCSGHGANLQAGHDMELDLLPRMCSWGTACGSCSARSVSLHSPMGSLRARCLWRRPAHGPFSPNSSMAGSQDVTPHSTSFRSPMAAARLFRPAMLVTAHSAHSLPMPQPPRLATIHSSNTLAMPIPLARNNSLNAAAVEGLFCNGPELSLTSLPNPLGSYMSNFGPDWSPPASIVTTNRFKRPAGEPPVPSSRLRRESGGVFSSGRNGNGSVSAFSNGGGAFGSGYQFSSGNLGSGTGDGSNVRNSSGNVDGVTSMGGNSGGRIAVGEGSSGGGSRPWQTHEGWNSDPNPQLMLSPAIPMNAVSPFTAVAWPPSPTPPASLLRTTTAPTTFIAVAAAPKLPAPAPLTVAAAPRTTSAPATNPNPATRSCADHFLDSGPIMSPDRECEAPPVLTPSPTSSLRNMRTSASEPHLLAVGSNDALDLVPPLAWSTAADGTDQDELSLMEALGMSWVDWNAPPIRAEEAAMMRHIMSPGVVMSPARAGLGGPA